jgi:hypothetical protein
MFAMMNEEIIVKEFRSIGDDDDKIGHDNDVTMII